MKSNDFSDTEIELSKIIVSVLELQILPSEIRPEEPLFGEGLGLDSIDALEISLEISKRYGLHIKAEDERNDSIFSSLRALAAHIEKHTKT